MADLTYADGLRRAAEIAASTFKAPEEGELPPWEIGELIARGVQAAAGKQIAAAILAEAQKDGG